MKRLIQLMSVALCLTILLSASLASVFALSMNGVAIGEPASAAADTLTATPDEPQPREAKLYKNESVYVIAGADGKVDKIIVSDWIQNLAELPTVTDVNALMSLENVKGDETYTMNADNMCVWQAQGKDLYLKGESKTPLPVDLSLSYRLDGQPIAPDALVGRSGDVTIRFDYTNNAYEDVEIDGKTERIYVPFLMLSGMVLDSESFTDVTVTNGKVISDGDRSIVAGIAFPGLNESLGLAGTEFNLPDCVEVRAHVEDFTLGTTITVATNAPLNSLDTSKLDGLDDIESAAKQLDDAMHALIDGSSQLYTGLSTLLDKSAELTAGIDALYSGASRLADGAQQVDQGASELNSGAVKIDLGMIDLSAGLNTLSGNNAALTGGSDQTFRSILATARDGLVAKGLDVPALTPGNYSSVLDGIVANLSDESVASQAQDAARAQVTAAVEANRDTVEAAVTAAVRENVQAEVESGVRAQVTAGVLKALGYSPEDYTAAVAAGLVTDAVQAQVNGAVDAQMSTDEIQATISALTEQNMQGEQAQAAVAANTDQQISALIEQNLQGEQVQAAIADALAKAAAGREAVNALKAQLDSYSYFNSGLKEYTSGVASAAAGANQLSAGASQLKNGSSALKSGTRSLYEGAVKLRDGILTLKNGVPALTEGVSKLKDGSMQLSEGLSRFNDEGISKVVSLLDGDLGSISKRLKATIEVSRRYKSYTGLTDEMDGEVKFIYKTEELNK